MMNQQIRIELLVRCPECGQDRHIFYVKDPSAFGLTSNGLIVWLSLHCYECHHVEEDTENA
ncbi:MAG: hypothetical protein NUW01_08890 [Gemmatimonadaceae bacterium]|nr:hypothetical protein [Gemmatimonadaceae bacterium]